jgi:hypothetical protein
VLNKKYHLEIIQKQIRGTGKLIYSIVVDGAVIRSVENKSPKRFDKVYVFANNPWHDSFEPYGKLSNLKITNLNHPNAKILAIEKENFAQIEKFEGEVELTKGNKVNQVFNNWGREYLVKLDIEINAEFTENWLNVFHMTNTDNNCCNQGDRLPAMFINKDKWFQLSSSLGSSGDHVFKFYYELNTPYHVEISQTDFGHGNFQFCIRINNVDVYCKKNNHPRMFDGVRLYLSDPWHGVLNGKGKLSNLEVINLQHYNPI